MFTIKYITSGLLGDVFHVLYVVKMMYQVTGKKGDLFFTNNIAQYGGEAFKRDLHNTVSELENVLLQQEYINSVGFLDDHKSVGEFINLNDWRKYLHMDVGCNSHERFCWLDLLSVVYKIPRDPSCWLTCNGLTERFVNKNIIHHSMVRYNPLFPWERILTNKQFVFVTCDKAEYDNFAYRNLVNKCEVLQTIDDMLCAIKSCRFFVGNQSSPAAMAIALGRPCLISLYVVDASWYRQRDWCKGRCFWYLDHTNKYMDVDKLMTLL